MTDVTIQPSAPTEEQRIIFGLLVEKAMPLFTEVNQQAMRNGSHPTVLAIAGAFVAVDMLAATVAGTGSIDMEAALEGLIADMRLRASEAFAFFKEKTAEARASLADLAATAASSTAEVSA